MTSSTLPDRIRESAIQQAVQDLSQAETPEARREQWDILACLIASPSSAQVARMEAVWKS